MRALACGEPFLEVNAEWFIPPNGYLKEMANDLDRYGPFPVFSEGHLYPRLGKQDARFVLAIADEYAKLIDKLGTDKIRELLGDDDG